MPAYIEWDSAYLARLSLLAADQTRVEAEIEAKSAAIDKYLGRFIVKAEYDQVFLNRTYEILLPAYPVDYVARVMTSKVDVATLTGSSAVSTFGVSSTALKLVKIVNGARTTTSLSFASYPTLSQLAAAATAVSGWSMTVASDYQSYPSTDLVEGQTGSAKHGAAISLWTDGSNYEVDARRGAVNLRGNWSSAWLADSCYQPEQVRIVWTGGYDPIPTDLQQICADLVASDWDKSKSRQLVSESLGEYSYTLDVASLPLSSKTILSKYKDRLV